METTSAFFTTQIQSAIAPATGCTEPVAIALNAATARKHVVGTIQKVDVKMDICLLKNAMGVGIPGSTARGVEMCVAVGLASGQSELGMNVLSSVKEAVCEEAEHIKPFVSVGIEPQATGLYIATTVTTDQDEVRVITSGAHDHIVAIVRPPYAPFDFSSELNKGGITAYGLADFLRYADSVPIEELYFLREGIRLNQQVAEEGKRLVAGKCIEKLSQSKVLDNSVIHRAQRETMLASYARMSGIELPVMTTTGSGNQGIALFLSVASVAEAFEVSEEKCLRALALAHLVNLYAKAHIGTLSALCACSIASSLSGSVGIIYMLDGSETQMIGCMRNIIGSITGMLCDGAKEGCANKVGLSVGLGVMSAFMSIEDFCIKEEDGILGNTMEELFENIKYIIEHGMAHTNQSIVAIMLQKGKDKK